MTIAALEPTRREAVVEHLRDPLYRNAYALALNSAATGVLGVLYWILAAHLFDVEEVGRDSSLISVITALSGLAQLNFTLTLPRLIPPSRHPTRWILRAYGSSTALAIIVGIAFVIVAPSFAPTLGYLRDEPTMGAVFVVALAGWGIFAIQDAALASLGRAPLVPIANLAFGIAKVALAIVFAGAITYRHSVLLSWIVPMVVLMVPINFVVFRHANEATRRRRRTLALPPEMAPMSRALLLDYLAGLAWLAYWGGVPLLVLSKLGETSAAHFNIAFAMGTALGAVSLAMGTSFTVEASGDPARTVELARRALRRIVAIVVPLGLAVAIGAHLLLIPFGEEYSKQGDTTLRLLGLAAIPAAVTNIALAVARVRTQAGFILGHRLLTATIGLTFVWVAMSDGSTTEVGIAWLATDVIMGTIAGTYLWRVRRQTMPSRAPTAAAGLARATEVRQPSRGSRRPRLLRRGSVSRAHRIAHGVFYLIGLGASVAVAFDVSFGPVRTALVLATMVLLPGGLVIGRTGIDEPLSEAAFGVGLSLAAWVIGAQVMLATGHWEPDKLLIVLTTISAVVWMAEPSSSTGPKRPRQPKSTSASGLVNLLQLTCLVAPVACLARTLAVFPDAPDIRDRGLVDVVSLWYYVGLALCGLGFWLALQREHPSRWLLGAQLAVLIVVIHALPAMGYDEVRPFWAFKHIGVLDYIVQHGAVDRSIDIYHNWPGFFALGAIIEQLTGLSPLNFARWSPLVSDLLWSAGLLYVMRTLTDNLRLRWLAVFLFMVSNWFVLDYFAPQPLAYFWALLVIGTMLQWLSRSSDRRWLDPIRASILRYSRTSRLGPDLPQIEATPADLGVRFVAGAAVLLMFTATTFTHQLTPFLLLIMCGSILLVRRTQGKSVIGLMLLITAAWIALAWQYLSNAGLLEIDFDLRRSHGGFRQIDLSEQTFAMWFFSRTGIYVHIAIFVTATVGIARRVRAGFLDTVAIVLAGAPALILAGQSYGGEGVYRVMLFSLITVSFLAACAFYPRYSSWQAAGTPVTTFVVCVGLAALVPVTIYGREQVNYVYPGEVDAALYVPEYAEPGWQFTTFCEGFPSRATADYLGYVDQQIDMPCMLRQIVHQDVSDETDDIIADFLESEFPERGQLLFAVSGGQRALIESYRLLPPGEYDHLLSVLQESDRFTVFYENPDAIVFELADLDTSAGTETAPNSDVTSTDVPSEATERGLQG